MYQIFRNVLTPNEIANVLKNCKEISHDHGEDGHGDEGHMNDPWEARTCMPDIADRIQDCFKSHNTAENFYAVDPWIKVYRLKPNNCEVKPHIDDDFVKFGLNAEWSVLVYLTDQYTGGETVFNHTEICPHLEAGSVLIFPHYLVHEGRKVISGEKIVLKTDLLFSNSIECNQSGQTSKYTSHSIAAV